jgi:hypothetical protein
MNGVLSGGWSFVWAAYLISAALLVGYTARTMAAYRASRRSS